MSEQPTERKATVVSTESPFEHENCNRWAIIVGISQYQDSRLNNLKYADRDAEKLYQLLLTPHGGHFQSDFVCKLTNKQATTANINRALRSFLKRPAKEDVVLIYFACHGSPDPERPANVYLLTYDTNPSDIAGTALPMGDIDRALKDTLLSEKVIILADTCHSAAIGSGIRSRSVIESTTIVNHYLKEMSKARGGTALLTSAEANEVSFEDKKWGGGHGVFTYYLLQGLKGAADIDKNGFIAVGELFEYVRENVKKATNHRQHPSIGTNPFDRNMPLAITVPKEKGVSSALPYLPAGPLPEKGDTTRSQRTRYAVVGLLLLALSGLTLVLVLTKNASKESPKVVPQEDLYSHQNGENNGNKPDISRRQLADAQKLETAALALMRESEKVSKEDTEKKLETLGQAILTWENAIATLKEISPVSQGVAEATKKLSMYEPQRQYAEALQTGFKTAIKAKASKTNTAENWREIMDDWQLAIDQLNTALEQADAVITTNENFYRQVQDKILEYTSDQKKANERRLLAPFRLAVNKANDANDAVKDAEALGNEQSSDIWLDIASLWGEAAELMQQVPSTNEKGPVADQAREYYADAQTKKEEYARNQADARRYATDLLALEE